MFPDIKMFMFKLRYALLLLLMLIVRIGFCEEKTYSIVFYDDNDIFSNYSNSTGTITTTSDGVEWTIESDAEASYKTSMDTLSFVQLGTGSSAVSYIRISTDGIEGRIKSVTVTAFENATNCTGVYLDVSVGDSTITKSSYITKRSASATLAKCTYKFDFFNRGEILINLERDSPALCGICFGSVTIVYNDAEEFIIDENDTSNNIEECDDAIVFLERTFSSEYWNTICLPFDMSEEEVVVTFGEGTKILEFSSVTEETTLNFTETTSMGASIPYLIKPATTVINPYFEDVAITETVPSTVEIDGYSFVGVYDATELNADDVFLSTDGSLYHPSADSNVINGMRAYFQLPGNTVSGEAKLNLGGTTNIIDVVTNTNASHEVLYNLNGQAINCKNNNIHRGIYIKGGKKVVIK